MAATRPKLPALKTPTTATFPMSMSMSMAFPGDALLSASSVRTPLSALSFKGPLPSAGMFSSGLPSAGLPSAPLEYPPTPSMLSAKQPTFDEKPEKTPITPPLAYMDFLKTINPASPAISSPPLTAPLHAKAALKRTATNSSTDSVETVQTIKSEDSTTEDELDSGPTSASSISTAPDCDCMKQHPSSSSSSSSSSKQPTNKPAPITIRHPAASPSGVYPLSAPATGPTTFPSLRVPPSPAVAGGDAVRTPWSARSIKSPFDWDAALKAKRYTEVPTSAPLLAGPGQQHSRSCEKKGTSVRHIREVVTRTVTYTPRMEPAPRGKRRKLNDEVEAGE